MPAKRKIAIKKKAKVVEPKVEEVKPEVIEEENVVSTVIENEISDDEPTPWTTYQDEEKILLDKNDVRGEIVWNGTSTTVVAPKGRIRFEAQVSAIPMFKIPADIRQYLINKWFSTNVWKKDKEWLEKHWADMEMIEKLKKFLTGNL